MNQLTNPTLLEDMTIDRIEHKLKYKNYPNRQYMTEQRIWANWLASN